jgi:hypothetical protein
MGKDRDDEGRYSKTYADSEFMSAVEDLPVASTQKVANSVGCSYDLAYRRLGNLFQREKLDREEVGNSFVYYVSD